MLATTAEKTVQRISKCPCATGRYPRPPARSGCVGSELQAHAGEPPEEHRPREEAPTPPVDQELIDGECHQAIPPPRPRQPGVRPDADRSPGPDVAERGKGAKVELHERQREDREPELGHHGVPDAVREADGSRERARLGPCHETGDNQVLDEVPEARVDPHLGKEHQRDCYQEPDVGVDAGEE